MPRRIHHSLSDGPRNYTPRELHQSRHGPELPAIYTYGHPSLTFVNQRSRREDERRWAHIQRRTSQRNAAQHGSGQYSAAYAYSGNVTPINLDQRQRIPRPSAQVGRSAEDELSTYRRRPRQSLHQTLLDRYLDEFHLSRNEDHPDWLPPYLDSPDHATAQPISAGYPRFQSLQQDEHQLTTPGHPGPVADLLQNFIGHVNAIVSGDAEHVEYLVTMRQHQQVQMRQLLERQQREREADLEYQRQLESQREAALQQQRQQERERDLNHDAAIRRLVHSLVSEDELSTVAITLTNRRFPAQLQVLTLKAAYRQSADGCPICVKTWSRQEQGPETFPTLCGNGMSEENVCSNFVCEDCEYTCASNQGKCPFCRQDTKPTDVERRRSERRRAGTRVDAETQTDGTLAAYESPLKQE